MLMEIGADLSCASQLPRFSRSFGKVPRYSSITTGRGSYKYSPLFCTLEFKKPKS